MSVDLCFKSRQSFTSWNDCKDAATYLQVYHSDQNTKYDSWHREQVHTQETNGQRHGNQTSSSVVHQSFLSITPPSIGWSRIKKGMISAAIAPMPVCVPSMDDRTRSMNEKHHTYHRPMKRSQNNAETVPAQIGGFHGAISEPIVFPTRSKRETHRIPRKATSPSLERPPRPRLPYFSRPLFESFLSPPTHLDEAFASIHVNHRSEGHLLQLRL